MSVVLPQWRNKKIVVMLFANMWILQARTLLNQLELKKDPYPDRHRKNARHAPKKRIKDSKCSSSAFNDINSQLWVIVDHLKAQMVSEKLVRVENHTKWISAMWMPLVSEHKAPFINGKIRRPRRNTEHFDVREKNDKWSDFIVVDSKWCLCFYSDCFNVHAR